MIVEKRGESKVFEGVWMCLGVFGREIKERRERICLGKLPNTSSFFQNEGSGDIYTGKLILRLPMHLVGPLATLLTSAVLAFPWSSFLRIFKGLSGL